MTTNGRRGADPVDDRPPPPARAVRAQPVAHHPGLRERECGEHADDVEVDQVVDIGVVDPDEERGRAGEHDDAVREDEPVAEVRELARDEAVAGEQRRKAGEPLVRRVRREDQTANVKIWTTQYIHPAPPPAGKTARAICETTESVELGRACVLHSEIGDADEDRDRDDAEHAERPRSVLRLRVTESVDAVRDRLDAGERARAGRERLQDEEDRDRTDAGGHRMRRLGRGQLLTAHFVRPAPTAIEHGDDESVCRQREREPGLADAAQVDDCDQRRSRRATAPCCSGSSDVTAEVMARTPLDTDTATVST